MVSPIPQIAEDGRRWIKEEITPMGSISLPHAFVERLVGNSRAEWVSITKLSHWVVTPEGERLFLRLVIICSCDDFLKIKAYLENENIFDETMRGALHRVAIAPASRTRLCNNGNIRIHWYLKYWARISKDVALIVSDKLLMITAWPLQSVMVDEKKNETHKPESNEKAEYSGGSA